MNKNVYWVGVIGVCWSLGVGAQTCDSSLEATTPASRFDDNGNGLVTDRKTGLIWKRCLEGLSGLGCTTGTVTKMSWEAALKAAEDSTFAGHSDWRLPNIKELNSIVERKCTGPAINLVVFPGQKSNTVWSGSPSAANSSYAWYVDFNYGYDYGYGRSSSFLVRLVRGGQ